MTKIYWGTKYQHVYRCSIYPEGLSINSILLLDKQAREKYAFPAPINDFLIRLVHLQEAGTFIICVSLVSVVSTL